MHRALWYVVRTRVRNRIRSWIAKLRTPAGIFTLLLIVLIMTGVWFLGDWGRFDVAGRQAVFATMLGFFLYSGIFSGLGQRGLLYSPADLDFLFPGPFTRWHLVVYQFTGQYLVAALVTLFYLVVFGGRFLPHPGWFYLGAFLCMVTSAHLATAAAEASMLMADRVFRRLRPATTALLILLTLAALVLVVGGITGWGEITGRLETAMANPVLRVLLYPAVQAAELGAIDAWGPRLGGLGGLLLCALASFVLVIRIPAELVENSFAASRKIQKRVADFKRGVFVAKVGRSREMPTARWARGAGAVLWLNWTVLRRQLRTTLGGLFVAGLVFAVVATRSKSVDADKLGMQLLVLLSMMPLWMHLPIGFRLPREQLGHVRALPLPPTRLAAAMAAVPVLAPFVLQVVGLLILLVIGAVAPLAALCALPVYLSATGTLVAVEGLFQLKKQQPNAVNLLLSMGQLLAQMLTLMPGIFVLVGMYFATRQIEWSLLAGAVMQSAVTLTLLASLGRRFQQREVLGASA